jgi:hypothetical protein
MIKNLRWLNQKDVYFVTLLKSFSSYITVKEYDITFCMDEEGIKD